MSRQEDRERARARPDDVIAAVLEDHADIEELFARVASAPGGGEKEEACRELVLRLVAHENAEQEVVHPLATDAARGVVDERLEEEKESSQLLSELERIGVDSPEFETRFATLRNDVLEHAEAEEREEHPVIERHHDTEHLRSLAAVFRSAEETGPTHPHPHGPTSGAGNMALSPLVALADRARDAVRSAMGRGSS